MRFGWSIGDFRLDLDKMFVESEQVRKRCAPAFSPSCVRAGDAKVRRRVALDRQLDILRAAQIRLASEQARYEIALRSELADIADGLRRYAHAKGGRRDDLDDVSRS